MAGQSILQAEIDVGGNATVRIVEYPRAGKDLDSYNSTIIVRRGQEDQRYVLADLIKGGQFFRIVETATLCTSSRTGTLFLAFETSATGANEGFVAIQYTPQTITAQALPPANQGRIVVKAAVPAQVELWAATASASRVDCDACEKHYAVQDCNVGQQSVECKQRPGPGEVLLPDNFMGARIEVR